MMTAYAVKYDEKLEYRQLILDILDIVSASPDDVELDDIVNFYKKNLSMKDWWIPLHCDFSDDESDKGKAIPDISPWAGATLVLSKRAYNLLHDSIKPFGEFLPIIVSEDQPYYLFNCLSYGVDDTEASESEYQNGERLWVKKLVSGPKDENQLLFKSKYERGYTLLCNQRFTEIINQLDLKGLSFDTELVRKFDL